MASYPSTLQSRVIKVFAIFSFHGLYSIERFCLLYKFSLQSCNRKIPAALNNNHELAWLGEVVSDGIVVPAMHIYQGIISLPL